MHCLLLYIISLWFLSWRVGGVNNLAPQVKDLTQLLDWLIPSSKVKWKICSKYFGYSTTSLCIWDGTYLVSITLTYALHRAKIRLTYWDISFRHGVQEVSITLPFFTANVEEKLGLTWNSTFNSTKSQWLFWHNIVPKCSLNP